MFTLFNTVNTSHTHTPSALIKNYIKVLCLNVNLLVWPMYNGFNSVMFSKSAKGLNIFFLFIINVMRIN